MTGLLVSIDLDDSWAYLRARGDADWAHAPSILELATSRLVDLLDLAGIEQATVFVVGRDARRAQGRRAIRRLVARGLEIADHSDGHRGELASRPFDEICRDLIASREAQAQVTGQLPIGFRCPSFGTSPALSSALRALDYRYDASTLPTSVGPLLRGYHRMRAGSGEHQPTYGRLRDSVAPLRPQQRDGMLQVPTTTLPLLRTPFHGSYLSALAAVSLSAAQRYARVADAACRAFQLPISFILHPTDVLDRWDAPQLAFFPGMGLPWQDKQVVLAEALTRFGRGRHARTMADLAAGVRP